MNFTLKQHQNILLISDSVMRKLEDVIGILMDNRILGSLHFNLELTSKMAYIVLDLWRV